MWNEWLRHRHECGSHAAIPYRFHRVRKTGVDDGRIFCSSLSQEIVMPSSRMRAVVSRATLAAAPVVATVLWPRGAFASQGPGGGMGTATSFTQLAMAILVYGASAIVVGAGLIGAVRGRRRT
jgi:hypothetical protein